MSYGFLDIAVTPGVRAAQQALGVADLWRDFKGHREFDQFTAGEEAFIAERDSFYMATVSETGWPYIQHRGGPPGFLKVRDPKTLAFADYRGNRQYLSVGNLSTNDRAALFLMDYAAKARLKILAHVEVVALDKHPALTQLVTVPDYKSKLERIFLLHLEAFDWNCPQHITPRYTEKQIVQSLRPKFDRLELLEAENCALRARIDALEAKAS